MTLPALTEIRGQLNTGVTSLTGGTQPADLVIRYFADFHKYLNPTETPFTSSLKRGKAVDQKKVEWGSSFLSPISTTTGATQGIGDLTMTVATGTGVYFQVNDVIDIEDERERVLDVNADVLTVARAQQGTSAAAHTHSGSGLTVKILGPAGIENSDTPLSPVARGAIEYNFPQLFEYGIHISNRENHTPDYEFPRGTKYEAYLQKLMKEAAIDFEQTAILGKRAVEGAMTGASASPTYMGGLDYFTDREEDMASAPITETSLAEGLQTLWTAVGPENMAKKALMGPQMRRFVSSLFNSNRLATVRDKETTLVWNSVETDFGTMTFTTSRYIPDGTIYLVNLEDITIHPYKGEGAWHETRLPASGQYIRGSFAGDYTMVFRNNLARLKFTNISTDEGDYPNL
jgi:hypothetical protein